MMNKYILPVVLCIPLVAVSTALAQVGFEDDDYGFVRMQKVGDEMSSAWKAEADKTPDGRVFMQYRWCYSLDSGKLHQQRAFSNRTDIIRLTPKGTLLTQERRDIDPTPYMRPIHALRQYGDVEEKTPTWRVVALPLAYSGGKVSSRNWARDFEPVFYDVTFSNDKPTQWITYGSYLMEWEAERLTTSEALRAKGYKIPSYKPSKQLGIPQSIWGWKRVGVYKAPSTLRGIAIVNRHRANTKPFILTMTGVVYRINEDKLLPAGHVSGTDRIHTESPSSLQYVLVELQQEKAYSILGWDGKKAIPLDVKDKDGKNIEPFVPAAKVEAKVIQAVSAMMMQRDKDAKQVEDIRKEDAEKLQEKYRAIREHNRSLPKTLQEYLQQNEKGTK